MKNILFAASECVPFIKTGGLADVVGALPKYFPKEKYDVRVVLPKYACMSDKYKNSLEYIDNFYINMDGRRQYVGILKTELDGITFYFIDNEEHFAGDAPYSGMPWDLAKFVYFCRASLAMLPVVSFRPDIIHCNDWQTGLIPAYIKDWSRPGTFYSNIKTVMTIHNLKFQGIWNIEDVKRLSGLNDSYFNYDKYENYGAGNLLKGGLAYADKITTVSRTYSNEICTWEHGEGLDPLLSYRKYDLCGIVNGIDYDVFDPYNDEYISAPYRASAFAKGKKKNKEDLQKTLGLKIDPNIMVIGMVSRMTDQKGFDIINYIMNDLLRDEVQIALLGTGAWEFENAFRYYASVYPDKISSNIFYSEEIAHKIYAGADAFLMPSLFEPCGLSQLISMRYGTVPIVRKTGGLADTVIPFFEDRKNSTGFTFDFYSADALLGTVRGAEGVFYDDKKSWKEIIKRAMKRDYSWNVSVKEYMSLYDSITA